MDNALLRFLASLGGADLRLLRQCPTEVGKYAGIGGTILFTGILAAVTGGFAFSRIPWDLGTTSHRIDPRLLAVPAGLLWGLAIINLDRYIVSTMIKRSGGLRLSEVLKTLYRFLLAISLAFAIALPLELAIFHQEIQSQLGKLQVARDGEGSPDKDKVRDAFWSSHATEYAAPELSKAIYDERNAERQRLWDEKVRWENAMNQELRGEYCEEGCTGEAGRGPRYDQFDARARMAEASFEDHVANVDLWALEEDWKEALQVRQELEAKLRIRLREEPGTEPEQYAGLLAELQALGELRDDNEEVRTIYWLLIVLMVLLETAPLTAKLLSERGIYDDLLELEHRSVILRVEKRLGVALEDPVARARPEKPRPEKPPLLADPPPAETPKTPETPSVPGTETPQGSPPTAEDQASPPPTPPPSLPSESPPRPSERVAGQPPPGEGEAPKVGGGVEGAGPTTSTGAEEPPQPSTPDVPSPPDPVVVDLANSTLPDLTQASVPSRPRPPVGTSEDAGSRLARQRYLEFVNRRQG